VLLAVVLFELWAICLRCRREHPYWKTLGQYRYAHRGWHAKPAIPENSMAAFRLAVENGFGAELDVHLMKDGHLAVIHDSSLRRTAGADVMVEDLTLAELRQYRLEGTDEPIPLLEEVLALFEGRTPLVVELKSYKGNHDALAEATMAMLDKFRVAYCVESFDPRCLMWLKKHRPDVVRGQLSQQFFRHRDNDPGVGKAVQFLLSNLFFNIVTQPDFIAYRFSDRKCAAVAICRGVYHVQEVNWTITDRSQMEAAEKRGNLVIFERFDPRA
jgi:glycerophosphoryl diester phosphodiesterase